MPEESTSTGAPDCRDALWQGIPDPRDRAAPAGEVCDLRINSKRWQHLISGHVANADEAWEEWLGADLCRELIAVCRSGTDPERRRTVFRRAGEKLAPALRVGCQRPMVILYENRSGGSPEQTRNCWLVVTPVGATAVVREEDASPIVWTCYFSADAMRAFRTGERWRAEAARLLQRYAIERNDGRFEHPAERRTVPVRQKTGVPDHRSHIHFVSLPSWGFRKEAERWVSDGPPAPWKLATRTDLVPTEGHAGPAPQNDGRLKR